MGETERRVVVVSGGGSGIGLGVAARFAAAGENVVILGRNEERLRSAVRSIGARAEWRQADLRDRSSVEEAAASILDVHPRIDVLVNSAGILKTVHADMRLADAERIWDEVVDSSLKGPFLLTVALASHLKSPGGRVVNIGSIVTQSGGSKDGYLAYTPAKAGVHGFTYALARELAPRGITANTVAPGFIADTLMTGDWTGSRVDPIVSQIPLGRAGRADDIANAVYWLASPEASYVTGATLAVNGGWRFH